METLGGFPTISCQYLIETTITSPSFSIFYFIAVSPEQYNQGWAAHIDNWLIVNIAACVTFIAGVGLYYCVADQNPLPASQHRCSSISPLLSAQPFDDQNVSFGSLLNIFEHCFVICELLTRRIRIDQMYCPSYQRTNWENVCHFVRSFSSSNLPST